jgi:hypothetical protein
MVMLFVNTLAATTPGLSRGLLVYCPTQSAFIHVME